MTNEHTKPSPLWQRAEQAERLRETNDGPLLVPFTELSNLMDNARKVLEVRTMDGEQAEMTPVVSFTSQRVDYFGAKPSTLSTARGSSASVSREKSDGTVTVDAQAHRVKGEPGLYFALDIHTKQPESYRYVIHDGFATDLDDPSREMPHDEIMTVYYALGHVKEHVETDLEATKGRLRKKLGAWSAKRANARAGENYSD